MKFDRSEYERLSDAEKAEYLRAIRDADLESTGDSSFPPGAIAPEKAGSQEGFEVVDDE